MSNQAVFLRGQKTVLRAPEMSDVPLLTKWVNDPEVRRFVSTRIAPVTEAGEVEWVKRANSDDKSVRLIIEADDKPIGTMGIHGINLADRRCTTGAMIGEKEYWGRGYGTDAKMILLHHAFNTIGLRKVCSDVIAYNERSLRYSLKCGYKEEGRRKDHIFREGKFWDLIELGLFKENWLPIWERYQETGEVR